MIGPRSEAACKAALRVEEQIRRLDGRMAAREDWRDAVAEWRHCVQMFGPGSASANGALIGLACLVRHSTAWVHSMTGSTAIMYVVGVLEGVAS